MTYKTRRQTAILKAQAKRERREHVIITTLLSIIGIAAIIFLSLTPPSIAGTVIVGDQMTCTNGVYPCGNTNTTIDLGYEATQKTWHDAQGTYHILQVHKSQDSNAPVFKVETTITLDGHVRTRSWVDQ